MTKQVSIQIQALPKGDKPPARDLQYLLTVADYSREYLTADKYPHDVEMFWINFAEVMTLLEKTALDVAAVPLSHILMSKKALSSTPEDISRAKVRDCLVKIVNGKLTVLDERPAWSEAKGKTIPLTALDVQSLVHMTGWFTPMPRAIKQVLNDEHTAHKSATTGELVHN